MKPEAIKRRLNRVETAIQYRTFNKAFIYDAFMLPGGKVRKVLNAGDNYEKDNNAVWLDWIIYVPEPGDKMPPPIEEDITADYKENHYEHYKRGLKKWQTERLKS